MLKMLLIVGLVASAEGRPRPETTPPATPECKYEFLGVIQKTEADYCEEDNYVGYYLPFSSPEQCDTLYYDIAIKKITPVINKYYNNQYEDMQGSDKCPDSPIAKTARFYLHLPYSDYDFVQDAAIVDYKRSYYSAFTPGEKVKGNFTLHSHLARFQNKEYLLDKFDSTSGRKKNVTKRYVTKPEIPAEKLSTPQCYVDFTGIVTYKAKLPHYGSAPYKPLDSITEFVVTYRVTIQSLKINSNYDSLFFLNDRGRKVCQARLEEIKDTISVSKTIPIATPVMDIVDSEKRERLEKHTKFEIGTKVAGTLQISPGFIPNTYLESATNEDEGTE